MRSNSVVSSRARSARRHSVITRRTIRCGAVCRTPSRACCFGSTSVLRQRIVSGKDSDLACVAGRAASRHGRTIDDDARNYERKSRNTYRRCLSNSRVSPNSPSRRKRLFCKNGRSMTNFVSYAGLRRYRRLVARLPIRESRTRQNRARSKTTRAAKNDEGCSLALSR